MEAHQRVGSVIHCPILALLAKFEMAFILLGSQIGLKLGSEVIPSYATSLSPLISAYLPAPANFVSNLSVVWPLLVVIGDSWR